MTPERPSVLRRRRLLRRKRLDAATSIALSALVLASLVLVGVLFVQPRAAPLAQVGPGAVYHTPVAQEGEPTPEDVVVPEQLALLYGGGSVDAGLSVPGGATTNATDFRRVWQAILQVLGQVSVGQISGARHIGFKPVAEAVAALPASGGVGVDATLGYDISWNDLLTAAGESPAPSGQSPTLDRIIVLSSTPGGGPELFLVSGASAAAIPLAGAQVSGLAAMLAGLRGHVVGSAYALRPLNATGALPASVARAVAVPQALLVPFDFPWQPVSLLPEALDAQALASAIFPDPLDVAQAISHGTQTFTNSQDWLLTVGPTAGEATFFRAPAQGGSAPGWYPGLRQVLNYVYRAGGWPASAWLSGFAHNAGTCLVACAVESRQYAFSVDAGGLPVLEPPGDSALTVTLADASGQPTSYTRDIPLSGAAQEAPSAPLPAATAAAIALQGAPSGDTEILQIFPAMAPRPSRGELRPAWAVVVANPFGGASQVVLVDAYSGTLLAGAQGGG